MAKAVRQHGRIVRDRQGQRIKIGSRVKTDIGNFVYRGSTVDSEGDPQVLVDSRDRMKLYPSAVGFTVKEEETGVSLHLMEEEAQVLALLVAWAVSDTETTLGGRSTHYWVTRLRKAFRDAGISFYDFYQKDTEFQELAMKSKGSVHVGTVHSGTAKEALDPRVPEPVEKQLKQAAPVPKSEPYHWTLGGSALSRVPRVRKPENVSYESGRIYNKPRTTEWRDYVDYADYRSLRPDGPAEHDVEEDYL